jgi:hypothetical protein
MLFWLQYKRTAILKSLYKIIKLHFPIICVLRVVVVVEMLLLLVAVAVASSLWDCRDREVL